MADGRLFIMEKTKIDWNIYPKNIPKVLINALIIGCVFLGLASLREGHDLHAWLDVVENWAFMLLWIPCGVAVCALPFKLRDDSFELKLAYYLGMFVALIFVINRLRYWHS